MGLCMSTVAVVAWVVMAAAMGASAVAAGKQDDAERLKNQGQVQAVYDLLDRVLEGSKDHFDLSFSASCPASSPPCFHLADGPRGRVAVSGTTAAELAYGVGVYLREYCNMTIGWQRGGGSRVFIPQRWPGIGPGGDSRRRNTPWSYIMNVCTHSYSFVWYSWQDWEDFIDWMVLSGINLYLAMTGQEEVQYKVFRHFGVADADIRHWFNGPALLAWSRGQNEYGAGIAGPLPRSFMQQQWHLQKRILARARSLGMSGQLPAFQGNVPVQLKAVAPDANITAAGATGWMNSVDPLYGRIADVWMRTLLADFGTDHWYQLDGYFNGATAPWVQDAGDAGDSRNAAVVPSAGGGWASHGEADGAPATGVPEGPSVPQPPGAAAGDDASWFARGAAAYQGLNRTDPDAVWSYQGWAFVGWGSRAQAAALRSFIDAVPDGKFNVIDMSTNGDGQWKMWQRAAFWGARFVWTTLHDFGGTLGIKGDLRRINRIPFDALPPAGARTNVWGTGLSPEGIDQNPAYYEFMLEANWRQAPVPDIAAHMIARAHRRYGLAVEDAAVTRAWALLVRSAYAQDLSVQDTTGVAHIGGDEAWGWGPDRRTPSTTLCRVYSAWTMLLDAADRVAPGGEPFRYDLVDVGREVLAQVAGPAGQNFTGALDARPPNARDIAQAGGFYAEVLRDLDALVGTDPAFMLGPWIAKARALAGNATDCAGAGYATVRTCREFYEWNARVQLTSWRPTPAGAAAVPKGPEDYAAKHWSGLISDYYAKRVQLVTAQAVQDAAKGHATPEAVVARMKAAHAYQWTTATKDYPTTPAHDAVVVSRQMLQKYAPFFTAC